jgi:hypothetical protein
MTSAGEPVRPQGFRRTLYNLIHSSLIEQQLKVKKCVALQLIVKWPYQSIEKVFLSLCIRVDFIWCIAGQMSKLI